MYICTFNNKKNAYLISNNYIYLGIYQPILIYASKTIANHSQFQTEPHSLYISHLNDFITVTWTEFTSTILKTSKTKHKNMYIINKCTIVAMWGSKWQFSVMTITSLKILPL